MMSDLFMEYMVKRRYDTKDKVIVAALVFGGVILSLLIFLVAMYFTATGVSMAFSIALLVIAGIWYGVYILMGKRNIEFEYILTNSEIDIDKIMSKRGRKRVASFDFKQANLVASVNDNEHNHVYKNNNGSYKVLDFSANSSEMSDVYFVDINLEGERKIILFQPTQRMLDHIRVFNPQKVFIMK